jgi:RNA polymerase sigma factor (sigma-70 family)
VALPPFQSLLDTHGVDVYRFLTALVGPLDADDCYQETWIAALRGYPRLRHDSNLRGWLLTIAHRKAIDSIRAHRRHPSPLSDAEVGESDGSHSASAGSLDGEVWELVRRLPDKQRTALTLRYVLDADYVLISSAMGTSEEAARRNVHEALSRLRREYRQ